MSKVNLISHTPVSCSKLERQKFEKFAILAPLNTIVKKAEVSRSAVLDKTAVTTKGLSNSKTSSTKMNEQKEASLYSYLLQLQEMTIKNPNNLPLRTQLTVVQNALLK